jgi:putative transposase
MARLPRLVLAGQAHYLIQRGHGKPPVFADAQDRSAYLLALRDASGQENVQIHAYALLDHEVQLLATPASAPALGRLVQAVGRRYVSAYNRRHARAGTLWDGRFRCCVVQAGAARLEVLRLIDGLSNDPALTSASQRLGGTTDPLLIDPPEFWQLGNTPFEREATYGRLLRQGLPVAVVDRLRRAVLGGWALGSAGFVADVEEISSRPAKPRQRGRPPGVGAD